MPKPLLTHPVFTNAEDFATLCKPLARFNITYFAHVNINNKNQYSATSNNPKYAEIYVKKRFFDTDIHTIKEDIFDNYILMDALNVSNSFIERRRVASQSGVNHVFTIVERHKNSKDYYHFGSDDPNNFSINHIYLANVSLLKAFIQYYKDTMLKNKVLAQAYEYKFDIDTNVVGFELNNTNELLDVFNNRALFLRDIADSELNSKELISVKNSIKDFPSITPQQLKCLSLLALGKSAKEIARFLNLSPRTVDHYLHHLRVKFHCKNSKELIALWACLRQTV